MANSVGIIDSGYRGNLLAKVDILTRKGEDGPENIGKQSRLFQICAHNLLPFKTIQLVDKSDKRFRKKATSRGDGGFGSTGK
jgi:dUTPase